MDPTNLINDVLQLVPVQYAAYLPYVFTVCGLLTATVMKAPADTSPMWYRGLYSMVNALALNIGYAKNASVLQQILDRTVTK